VPDGDLFEDDGNSKDGPPDDLRLLLIDFGLKDKIRSSSDDEKSWYQIIRDSYNYICAPHEMGEVYALSSGSEYEIEFQDSDGLNYGFDGLSSGERSVLNFMVQYVYKRMRSSIVLIDELEQHLHPTWQRRLMQNLLRLNDGNQFIVTTHSPAIQQAAPSDSIIELGKLSEQIPDWQLAEAGE
jgi:predicted ATPase